MNNSERRPKGKTINMRSLHHSFRPQNSSFFAENSSSSSVSSPELASESRETFIEKNEQPWRRKQLCNDLIMLVVTPEDLGERLDKLLSTHFPTHSRTYFQMLIEESCVLLNSHPTRKQHKVDVGDRIEVTFKEPPLLDVVPEKIELDILYEDDHLIAINKPASMVVHPGAGVYSGTFANALLHHCQSLNTEDFEPFRPGIVHRLDKDTTGVLIGAKTKEAHRKLSAQFAERKVQKKYLAICCNTPPDGEFSAKIRRHPIRRKEMTLHEEGKEAISHFKVLAKNGELSFVEVDILTGRTHQIRVHLQALKCPVLGDPVYGSEKLNQKHGVSTQLLHAYQLVVTHPITGEPLELVAPPPSAMKNFIELIRRAD